MHVQCRVAPGIVRTGYTVPRVTLGVPTGSLDVSRWVGQRSQLRSPPRSLGSPVLKPLTPPGPLSESLAGYRPMGPATGWDVVIEKGWAEGFVTKIDYAGNPRRA